MRQRSFQKINHDHGRVDDVFGRSGQTETRQLVGIGVARVRGIVRQKDSAPARGAKRVELCAKGARDAHR